MDRTLQTGDSGDDVTDVKVQLNRTYVMFMGRPLLTEDNRFDAAMQAELKLYQSAVGLTPSGVVDQDTYTKLFPADHDGAAPGFVGCNVTQRHVIERSVQRARELLDNTLSMLDLAPYVPSVAKLVKNNFDIDLGTAASEANPIAAALDATTLMLLRRRYQQLRRSLDQTFPRVCVATDDPIGTIAFVQGTTDPTMNFRPLFFTPRKGEDRAATIVHERAHTIFKAAGRPGMGGGLATWVGATPDNDKRSYFGRPFFDFAFANPYCYEWLAVALMPGYDSSLYSTTDRISAAAPGP
jgi:hypothetical protein